MCVSFRKCLGTDTPTNKTVSQENVLHLALIPLNGGAIHCKRNERQFNYDFQVFSNISLVICKMFVSFRKCLGTDTPQIRLFPTKRFKSCSETP